MKIVLIICNLIFCGAVLFCLFVQIMIEAVENHMPETIIIDEIGTELEALAASTIAQRGVQLVGTAHGTTIESIMKNPYLQILVGGIEVQKLLLFIFLQVYDL